MSIKYMDLEAFREEGWLQEVNRLFFHPRGLALEMNIDNEGVYSLSGVWDYRDDPEGIIFGEEKELIAQRNQKVENVKKEYDNHKAARIALLGGPIQVFEE